MCVFGTIAYQKCLYPVSVCLCVIVCVIWWMVLSGVRWDTLLCVCVCVCVCLCKEMISCSALLWWVPFQRKLGWHFNGYQITHLLSCVFAICSPPFCQHVLSKPFTLWCYMLLVGVVVILHAVGTFRYHRISTFLFLRSHSSHISFSLSSSSFRFVKQCQRFIEENRLSRSLFATECLPTLITLSYDKIPNIRIAVARLLKNHLLEIGNGIFFCAPVLTNWDDGLSVWSGRQFECSLSSCPCQLGMQVRRRTRMGGSRVSHKWEVVWQGWCCCYLYLAECMIRQASMGVGGNMAVSLMVF